MSRIGTLKLLFKVHVTALVRVTCERPFIICIIYPPIVPKAYLGDLCSVQYRQEPMLVKVTIVNKRYFGAVWLLAADQRLRIT